MVRRRFEPPFQRTRGGNCGLQPPLRGSEGSSLSTVRRRARRAPHGTHQRRAAPTQARTKQDGLSCQPWPHGRRRRGAASGEPPPRAPGPRRPRRCRGRRRGASSDRKAFSECRRGRRSERGDQPPAAPPRPRRRHNDDATSRALLGKRASVERSRKTVSGKNQRRERSAGGSRRTPRRGDHSSRGSRPPLLGRGEAREAAGRAGSRSTRMPEYAPQLGLLARLQTS